MAKSRRTTAFGLARKFRLAPVRLATGADEASLKTARDRWILELAWDGHRVLACRFGEDVCLVSSDDREWSDVFSTVASALRKLPSHDVVLEGHLCALDDRAHPSFDLLRTYAHQNERRGRIILAASDLLWIDGEDLRKLPLETRRARLAALLAGASPPLVVSEALDGSLDVLLAAMRDLGVRGVIARPTSAEVGAACLAVSSAAAPFDLHQSLSAPPIVTNAAKVLFPRDGINKQDIVDFYADVAPVLLPYMQGRPIVCQRWPDGIDAFTWYQHRLPPRSPDYLRAEWIDEDRRIFIDDARALLWLVNQAALTFHGWTSRLGTLANPDWAIIDLDPGEETAWADTIEVAVAIRKLLELLELPSVVKTSGQRGLHVLIPLAPGHTVHEAQEIARRMSLVVARLLPEKVTLALERKARGGRLYLDCVQGFVGKSLVLPYSLRATDGAPVSTPLDWSEVTPTLDPKAFSLRTLRRRLDARGDLARPLLAGTAVLAAALARLLE